MIKSDYLKGVLAMLASAFGFAFMGAMIKLSGNIPVMQKTFFRNLIASSLAGFALYKEIKALSKGDSSDTKFKLDKKESLMLAGRAIFGTIGLIANFYAIDRMVISDAAILNKLSPFFVIIFSYMLLNEKPEVFQWKALITAFLGTILVLRPSSSLFAGNLGPKLVGVMSGLCAGLAYTLMRILLLRSVSRPLIIFVFSAFSTLLCVPFLIFNYYPMTTPQLLMLIGAGLGATLGQFGITTAYKYAPAKELSVYDYTNIIFSALFSIFLLNQYPDRYSIAGYIVIIGSGVYMFFKQKKLSKH